MLWYISGTPKVRRITCGMPKGEVKVITDFFRGNINGRWY